MPIRLFVQKQASASTSECTSWQKNCSAKHGIPKSNKRKKEPYVLIQQNS